MQITITIDVDDGFDKYRYGSSGIYSGSIDTILNDKFGKDAKYFIQSSHIREFIIVKDDTAQLTANEVRRIIRGAALSGPSYFKEIKFLNASTLYVKYNDTYKDTNY